MGMLEAFVEELTSGISSVDQVRDALIEAVKFGVEKNRLLLKEIFPTPADYALEALELVPRWDDDKQYLWFFDPVHPLSCTNGWVAHHRHVAAVAVGRWLTSEEHVHHIDENSLNNDPGNLQVVSGKEHGTLHGAGKYPLRETECEVCGRLTRNLRFCDRDCYQAHRSRTRRRVPFTREQVEELLPTHTYVALGEMFKMKPALVRYYCLHRLGFSLEELAAYKEIRREHGLLK